MTLYGEISKMYIEYRFEAYLKRLLVSLCILTD